MSYKWRCTAEGEKLKLWLVLLLQKGRNLCLFIICRCVDNYHKGVQVYGCVCGIGGGGDGSVSDCLGEREDATTKEGMRWSKDFLMSCLLNFFSSIGEEKHYILYT